VYLIRVFLFVLGSFAAFSVTFCFENELYLDFVCFCVIMYSVLQCRAINALVKICILLLLYLWDILYTLSRKIGGIYVLSVVVTQAYLR